MLRGTTKEASSRVRSSEMQQVTQSFEQASCYCGHSASVAHINEHLFRRRPSTRTSNLRP
eukprot:1324387-Amphidinium_carterae.1